MKRVPKKEKRSWTVTIVAGLIAIGSLYVALGVFSFNVVSLLISIACGAFCVLATIIAMQGKPRTLRELVDSLIHLPWQ